MFRIEIPNPFLYVLILCRVGTILLLLPMTGSAQLPTKVRIIISVVISYLAMFSVPLKVQPEMNNLANLFFASLSEIGLGFLASIFAVAIYYAIEIGSQLIGFQMGFAIVNVIDPVSGNQVSLVGAFEALVAMAVYIVTGLYRPFIAAICQSFKIVAPGSAILLPLFHPLALKAGGLVFFLGLKIAAPVMIALLVTTFALGIISRTIPQLNIFMVGFPVTISVGLLFLVLSLPVICALILNNYNTALKVFWQVLVSAAQ